MRRSGRKLDVDVKAAAFEGLFGEGRRAKARKVQDNTSRRGFLFNRSCAVCNRTRERTRNLRCAIRPAARAVFLVSSYEWLMDATTGGALDRELAKRIKKSTYYGQELVARPRRLALMNLYLHGLEPTIKSGDSIYEVPDSQRFDLILTNPPFGTKGANQAPDREDFTIATSNKQLNFIQHVLTLLKTGRDARPSLCRTTASLQTKRAKCSRS